MFIDWSLLRFPFDDPRWKGKFAIGGLLYVLALFLNGPFILLYAPLGGFGYQIMRRAARNEERRLPEWEGWGKLFVDGIKVFGVSFVYFLPVTIILTCFAIAFMAVMFGSMGALEASRFSSRGGFEGAFFATMMGLFAAEFAVIACISLLSVPLGFLNAVALSRMAATDSFSSALQFREVWELAKRGLPNYALATVVLLGVSTVGSLLASTLSYTIVLACLYPFAMAFVLIYVQVLSSVLFGMAYYHTQGGKREDVKVALEASRKSTAPLNMPKQDHVDPKDEFSTMPGTPASITGTMISDKTPPTSVEGDLPKKKAAPLKKRSTKKPGSESPNKG